MDSSPETRLRFSWVKGDVPEERLTLDCDCREDDLRCVGGSWSRFPWPEGARPEEEPRSDCADPHRADGGSIVFVALREPDVVLARSSWLREALSVA